MSIGPSVAIKGDVQSGDDLTFHGQLNGSLEVKNHVLTVGPKARIQAQLFARIVVVFGEVLGDITATERVDIRDNASVKGDIVAPRVAIAEGAHFLGSIDMLRQSSKSV